MDKKTPTARPRADQRQRESSCFISPGLLVRKTMKILYIYIYTSMWSKDAHETNDPT